MLKTIEQIISWAWNDAQGTNGYKTNRITMNEKLEAFLAGAQDCFAGADEDRKRRFGMELPDTLKPLERLLKEQLLNIVSETQIRTFLQVHWAGNG